MDHQEIQSGNCCIHDISYQSFYKRESRMKRIVILGSTGSIGTQALEIIRQYPEKFKVVGLTANRNVEKLQEQIAEFKPEAVCITDREKAEFFKTDIPLFKGEEGLKEMATLDSDLLI